MRFDVREWIASHKNVIEQVKMPVVNKTVAYELASSRRMNPTAPVTSEALIAVASPQCPVMTPVSAPRPINAIAPIRVRIPPTCLCILFLIRLTLPPELNHAALNQINNQDKLEGIMEVVRDHQRPNPPKA